MFYFTLERGTESQSARQKVKGRKKTLCNVDENGRTWGSRLPMFHAWRTPMFRALTKLAAPKLRALTKLQFDFQLKLRACCAKVTRVD